MEIQDLTSYIQHMSSLRTKYLDFSDPPLCELLFRGHADVDYVLSPSLARPPHKIENERDLVDLAKYRYPDVFRDDMTPIQLLALLQHYGIPTRLLDVTESALVALYFACCDKLDKDGEVFVFVRENNGVDIAPVINGIADTYRLTRRSDYDLDWFVDALRSQNYFDEHRHVLTDEMFGTANEFFDIGLTESEKHDIESCADLQEKIRLRKITWLEGCCKNNDRPIFLYAPVYTLRQQLQRGRFILFPNKIEMGQKYKHFVNKIEAIPKNHRCIPQRFIIKHDAKRKLLRDLELCGICEESLFFDSVDKVCHYLASRGCKAW